MEIRFRIDPNRMTWGDQIALEERETQTRRQLRDMVARHMVGADDVYLPFDQACAALAELDSPGILRVVQAFTDAIGELQNKQVPPASGGG